MGDLDSFITKNKMNVLFIGSSSFIASLLKKKIKIIFCIISKKDLKIPLILSPMMKKIYYFFKLF